MTEASLVTEASLEKKALPRDKNSPSRQKLSLETKALPRDKSSPSRQKLSFETKALPRDKSSPSRQKLSLETKALPRDQSYPRDKATLKASLNDKNIIFTNKWYALVCNIVHTYYERKFPKRIRFRNK